MASLGGENCPNTVGVRDTNTSTRQVSHDSQPVRTTGFRSICNGLRVTWQPCSSFHKKYWGEFYTQVKVYVEVHNIRFARWKTHRKGWDFDLNRKRTVDDGLCLASRKFPHCSDDVLRCSIYTCSLFCQKEISWDNREPECVHTIYTGMCIYHIHRDKWAPYLVNIKYPVVRDATQQSGWVCGVCLWVLNSVLAWSPWSGFKPSRPHFSQSQEKEGYYYLPQSFAVRTKWATICNTFLNNFWHIVSAVC